MPLTIWLVIKTLEGHFWQRMIGFESVGWKNSSTCNLDLVTFITLHGTMILVFWNVLLWLCIKLLMIFILVMCILISSIVFLDGAILIMKQFVIVMYYNLGYDVLAT